MRAFTGIAGVEVLRVRGRRRSTRRSFVATVAPCWRRTRRSGPAMAASRPLSRSRPKPAGMISTISAAPASRAASRAAIHAPGHELEVRRAHIALHVPPAQRGVVEIVDHHTQRIRVERQRETEQQNHHDRHQDSEPHGERITSKLLPFLLPNWAKNLKHHPLSCSVALRPDSGAVQSAPGTHPRD